MAKLTKARRDAIPTGEFALGGRRYPIEDASHARNALARVSQHGTPGEKATVREKVHAKYPGIGSGSKAHHLRKAHEHVTAAHRQHTMDGAREHLSVAMAHMKKAGVAHSGESHGYSFREGKR
jgi:hypothetical protein